jgi:hypothetical protein
MHENPEFTGSASVLQEIDLTQPISGIIQKWHSPLDEVLRPTQNNNYLKITSVRFNVLSFSLL